MDLKEFWYIVCESKDLKRNKPRGVGLLSEWVVLFRDSAGMPVALQDACLHRNARLSDGRVENGNLVCPYHGWAYNKEGQVQKVPSEGPSYRPPVKWCNRRFEAIEKDGYVYVRLQSMTDLKGHRADPFVIPYLGKPGYQHLRVKHVFQSSVPNCAENFIDIPHTSYVHPNIFRYQQEPQKLTAEMELEQGNVHVRYCGETSNFGIFSKFLNRSGTEIFHEDHYYFPNVTHVEYRFANRRHFNITSQSVPVSDRETHVYTDLTWDYGFWNRLSRPFVRQAAKKIIEQDVQVMKRQNEVIEKYGEKFTSTRSDLQHLWIEKIYDYLKSGKNPLEIQSKKEKVEFWI